MNLQLLYEQFLKKKKSQLNNKQIQVVSALQTLVDYFNQPSLWKKFKHSFSAKPKSIYIYGTSGTGKTMLMNIFFYNFTFSSCVRLHFHEFMRKYEEDSFKLRQAGYTGNIVTRWTEQLAQEAKVVCLDELYVTDIVHAQLVNRIIHHALQAGITFIITSNRSPDSLYQDKTQQALIKELVQTLDRHFTILDTSLDKDYRSQLKHKESQWLITRTTLTQQPKHYKNITLSKTRHFKAFMLPNKNLWLDATEFLNHNFAYKDYLKIIQQTESIYMVNLPILSAENKNQLFRFIQWIDIIYDKRKLLTIESSQSLDDLIPLEKAVFEFTRCLSRLRHMQSKDYFNMTKTQTYFNNKTSVKNEVLAKK